MRKILVQRQMILLAGRDFLEIPLFLVGREPPRLMVEILLLLARVPIRRKPPKILVDLWSVAVGSWNSLGTSRRAVRTP